MIASFLAFLIFVSIGLYFANKHDKQQFEKKVSQLDEWEEEIS